MSNRNLPKNDFASIAPSRAARAVESLTSRNIRTLFFDRQAVIGADRLMKQSFNADKMDDLHHDDPDDRTGDPPAAEY
jgi:hypothetical protein